MEDIMGELRSGVSSLSSEQLLRAAIHEAGHALVASLLKIGDVLRVSIEGSGPNGGTTVVHGAGGMMLTRSDCLARLMFALAGRAAEEVALGQASGGSGGGQDSDLALATELALSMETSLGLVQGHGLLWLQPRNPRQMSAVIEIGRASCRDRV